LSKGDFEGRVRCKKKVLTPGVMRTWGSRGEKKNVEFSVKNCTKGSNGQDESTNVLHFSTIKPGERKKTSTRGEGVGR